MGKLSSRVSQLMCFLGQQKNRNPVLERKDAAGSLQLQITGMSV
jgi:hypothetical protein